MDLLFEALRRRGWKVETTSHARARPLLPPAVAARYSGMPTDVVEFLSSVERCRAPDEAVWFLTADDYARSEGSAFRWNEYELMALEDAADDGALRTEIMAFWNRHFPFMLAVHSDYDYLAVDVVDGAVVHGCAPEWESPSPVAASFGEFLRTFEVEAAAAKPRWPFSVFIRAFAAEGR